MTKNQLEELLVSNQHLEMTVDIISNVNLIIEGEITESHIETDELALIYRRRLDNCKDMSRFSGFQDFVSILENYERRFIRLVGVRFSFCYYRLLLPDNENVILSILAIKPKA